MIRIRTSGFEEWNLRKSDDGGYIYRKPTQGNGMREMENKQEWSHVGTKEHFNDFNVFSM